MLSGKFIFFTERVQDLGLFQVDGLVLFLVFNATLNNISVISWQSVLLVEETVVPGENHQPIASH